MNFYNTRWFWAKQRKSCIGGRLRHKETLKRFSANMLSQRTNIEICKEKKKKELQPRNEKGRELNKFYLWDFETNQKENGTGFPLPKLLFRLGFFLFSPDGGMDRLDR